MGFCSCKEFFFLSSLLNRYSEKELYTVAIMQVSKRKKNKLENPLYLDKKMKLIAFHIKASGELT